jgi:N-acetyl-anhydromuramyl-L-alanine amidase AmpD
MAVQPRDSHAVSGMGRVYDWRGTGLLPPSGGLIPLRAFVHHIPVVPNVAGISDFYTLANVLNAQRLSLQFATDREGNVALFNEANRLCYQARGLNSLSCGCEHMHMTITEPWTERQYRAAAWLTWWVHKNHGLPMQLGWLKNAGPGLARVTRPGHVTHQHEADVAGFHDRTDPGRLFSRSHVFELAGWYETHRSFTHAPKV